MYLFGHTKYATNGLNGKCLTMQFTENKQHGSTGTIPTQCNCLFENQHFGHVVVIFQVVQILFLLREPNG